MAGNSSVGSRNSAVECYGGVFCDYLASEEFEFENGTSAVHSYGHFGQIDRIGKWSSLVLILLAFVRFSDSRISGSNDLNLV